MKELDIEKLENVEFEFDKNAFKTEMMHCDKCNINMEKVNIEMNLLDSPLSIKLKVFRCHKCNKEYLNFEEAKKLDKALVLLRLMSYDSYKIKKSLSFDGDNYIFRIPAEISKNFGKGSYAEMTPLSSQDLLIHLKKKWRKFWEKRRIKIKFYKYEKMKYKFIDHTADVMFEVNWNESFIYIS